MPPHLDVTCEVFLTWEDIQTRPVPGYGSAQEPEVERGSEKLHWEEEVIRPVIFGNNHDPLQEVILNEGGEGWEEEACLLVVTVYAER